MLQTILRSCGAIVLGLVVAMACIVVVEVVTIAMHPFPPGMDMQDEAAMKAHVAKFPNWVLAVGVIGWGITAFASSWVATRVGTGRHPAHGIAIGVLLLLMAALNMYMLPYPLWMEIAVLICLPLSILAAVKLGRGAIVPGQPEEPVPANG